MPVRGGGTRNYRPLWEVALDNDRTHCTHTMASRFESLPVELIADILGELDIQSLLVASWLSRRLRLIVGDASMNPWRRPILRILRAEDTEAGYCHVLHILGSLPTLPTHNWIDIHTMARPDFLIFEASPPPLPDSHWEECYKRRFLPGWMQWRRKEEPYRKLFHKCVLTSISAVIDG